MKKKKKTPNWVITANSFVISLGMFLITYRLQPIANTIHDFWKFIIATICITSGMIFFFLGIYGLKTMWRNKSLI